MRRKFDATVRQYEVKTAETKVGKNLFDKDWSPVQRIIIAEDGSLYHDDTSRTVRVNIRPNTTYTVSVGMATNLNIFRCAFADTDADPTVTPVVSTAFVRQAKYTPITMTSGDNDVVLYVQMINNSLLSTYIDTLQIEVGSEATEYEPYTGVDANEWTDGLKSGFPSVKLFGAASQAAEPTPDAPQDVVANNATVRSCGVNMWGGARMAKDIMDSGYGNDTEYAPYVRYSASSASSAFSMTQGFKENARYTVILRGFNTLASYPQTTNARFRYTDGSQDVLFFDTETEPVDGVRTCVFTSDANKTVAFLQGRNGAGNTVLDTSRCGVFEGVLTEEDFVPHYDGGEATAPTLYAIGDYRDEWNPQTGKGLRRIGKVEFTGDETFDRQDKLDNVRRLSYFPGDMISTPGQNNGHVCCTHFITEASGANREHCCGRGESIHFFAKYEIADEPNTFKSWLAEQYATGTPVIAYYVLAEPVPFETEPMPLSCPTGYGQIVQLAGDIPDCPLEVKYLSHGGNKA